jgi:hypothetical protein
VHNINIQFIKTVYFESKSDSSSAVFCKICRYITSVSNFKQASVRKVRKQSIAFIRDEAVHVVIEYIIVSLSK